MALVIMAVWDTRQNKRNPLTKATLDCLKKTVDWERHRCIVVDNGSYATTATLLKKYNFFETITLEENIGQARALNKALERREPGEICVRMDSDVIINQSNWIEDMEYALEKDPKIALVGLKRKNAWERPDHEEEPWRSELKMLPHKDGERWMVVEVAKSILGTCQALRPEFLAQIGYFYQMGSLWGFIDPITCTKAHALGYKTVYLPHIDIDYLEKDVDDSGKPTKYHEWKDKWAADYFPRFEEEKQRILNGGSVYNGPEDD